MHRTLLRLLLAIVTAVVTAVVAARPALARGGGGGPPRTTPRFCPPPPAAPRACGGLVAPNGTIRLLRTSTLAAWHDGVEHYVTSFQFAGDGAEFGSIIPLPGIPTNVERGGDWTLQRLAREVAPPLREADSAGA